MMAVQSIPLYSVEVWAVVAHYTIVAQLWAAAETGSIEVNLCLLVTKQALGDRWVLFHRPCCQEVETWLPKESQDWQGNCEPRKEILHS